MLCGRPRHLGGAAVGRWTCVGTLGKGNLMPLMGVLLSDARAGRRRRSGSNPKTWHFAHMTRSVRASRAESVVIRRAGKL